jgi:hypothetical protein
MRLCYRAANSREQYDGAKMISPPTRIIVVLSVLTMPITVASAASYGRPVREVVPHEILEGAGAPGLRRAERPEVLVGGERITSPEDLFLDFDPRSDDNATDGDKFSVAKMLLRSVAVRGEPFALKPQDSDGHSPTSDEIRDRIERDFIEAQFANRGLDASKWRSSPGSDFASRLRFLKALDLAIPGGRLEVATFFDRSVFKDPLDAMKEALGREPEEIPLTSVETYFATKPGGILIVIGHVEKNSFVLRDVRNNFVTHDIVDLVRLADINNIMLIPIGCKTAMTGAPIGSTRNITTNDIVTMLKQLKERNDSLRDVFAALQTIGNVQINFNWAGKAIEAIILDGKSGVPKVHFSFPTNVIQPAGITQQWEKEIGDIQEIQEKIILDRISTIYVTGFDRLRLVVIDHPIYTFLFCCIVPYVYFPIATGLSRLKYFRLDRRRIYCLVFLRYSAIGSGVLSVVVFWGVMTWLIGGVLIPVLLIAFVIGVPYYFVSESIKNTLKNTRKTG